MSEVENLKIKIEKKKEEIENLKTKLKKKKSELQLLTDQLERILEQEEVAFNAKVVAEMEQRFGKYDEDSFEKFWDELVKEDASHNLNIF